MKTVRTNKTVQTKIINLLASNFTKPYKLALLRAITDTFPSVAGFVQNGDGTIKLNTFYGFLPCTFSIENESTRGVNQHLTITSYDVELLFDFPSIKKAVTIRVSNRFEKFNQDPDVVVYNCELEMDLDGFKNEFVSNKFEELFRHHVAPRIETAIEQYINDMNERHINLTHAEFMNRIGNGGFVGIVR